MTSADEPPVYDERRRAGYFGALFAASDDPWRFRDRWYEARKRAATLACLPHPRYRLAYEPGCANGELSAALAERCDRLLVSDGAPAAVAASRRRLAAFARVEVFEAWAPEGWPDERFDLVVLSEVVYYLGADSFARLIERLNGSLTSDGTVLACHWRHPIAGCAWGGDEVQQRLEAALGLPTLATLLDRDFRLDVWGAAPTDLAAGAAGAAAYQPTP